MSEENSRSEWRDGPDAGADATRCAACGAVIDPSEWHPVATRFDDGEFHLFTFCCDDCRDAWLTE